MPIELVAVVAIAVLVTAWLLWRFSRSATTASGGHTASSATAVVEVRPEFPPAGLLVPEDVLRSVGSTSAAIWDALEAAAAPVAVEYYPVSEPEVAKLRTVPVNATAQQAMVGIVEALNPKGPTLFRVVLPKGAELVKAAGSSGFRGFSRSGGKTAHAVLKPVAAGGAIAAGWPVLAVAGTVLAVDMVAQREQRAHQRRVEAILGRQEERHYIERVKDQRSADAQLSRVISLMLDGHNPNIELALKSADDEFYRSQQFLEKHRGVTDELVDEDGKVDYRRLEEILGGETKETDHFIRELHLARAAITIRRKAMVAEAAAVALADPTNPYAALRRFLESQVHQLEDADAVANELTERLTQVQLKGRWYDSDKSVAARQEWLRARVSPSRIDGDTEIRYVMTSSGQILQVLPPDEDEPLQLAQGE
ncbi:hypothetical protein ABT404_17685 [Streptomyces hyaluromycini]|uniref:Uncharacterized protein n=1 Tax=Streptomyces hyaluromycini TaxID=1377993 RepID=A0ABV1WWZ4_9ACTN